MPHRNTVLVQCLKFALGTDIVGFMPTKARSRKGVIAFVGGYKKAPMTGALLAVLDSWNSSPGLSAFELSRKTQAGKCQAQQGEARRFRNAGGGFLEIQADIGAGKISPGSSIGAELKVADIQIERKTSGPATACLTSITQQRIDPDTKIVSRCSLVRV